VRYSEKLKNQEKVCRHQDGRPFFSYAAAACRKNSRLRHLNLSRQQRVFALQEIARAAILFLRRLIKNNFTSTLLITHLFLFIKGCGPNLVLQYEHDIKVSFSRQRN
jgi:hypothetical protein